MKRVNEITDILEIIIIFLILLKEFVGFMLLNLYFSVGICRLD
jgi:hypothetical protein